MIAVRRFFRHAAALALVAMLGLALAPTISHALATRLASVQPWGELCSVDRSGDAGATLAHCPLCAQTGHTPVLPATPQVTVLPTPDPVAATGCAAAGIALALPWIAPPSRAPPPAAA
ncbi:MAG: DUF2946 family protein [Piscinibacter sp.]